MAVLVQQRGREEIRDDYPEADSICSLIYYREPLGLSEQTKYDLKSLIDKLRPVTDAINRSRATDFCPFCDDHSGFHTANCLARHDDDG
jgi:hypothetical protein